VKGRYKGVISPPAGEGGVRDRPGSRGGERGPDARLGAQGRESAQAPGPHAFRRGHGAGAVPRLGDPAQKQPFFSGFAANAEDWPRIVKAAVAAQGAVAEVFVWALPQIVRDGLTLFGKEDDVTPFEDVDFPIAIGAKASVSPGFSTDIVLSASGHEHRNANWSQARMRFDAGPGVRGEEELGELIAFHLVKRGISPPL